MDNKNSTILTDKQEMQLRKPIDDYIGKIQSKIDNLRAEGTDRIIFLQNNISTTKKDRTLSKGEKDKKIAEDMAALEKAKAVESKNKDEVSKLISDAESYLKMHFDKDYYQPVKENCVSAKEEVKDKYQAKVAKLKQEHQENISKLSNHQEIKDENYVYKNRLFDAKMVLEKDLQQIKDKKHAASGKKDDENIILAVSDNGAGIPEEEVLLLLTDNNHVHKHGSGVGLVNVNNRIQILFGKQYGLTIESEPDEGTTVSICIPAIPYTEENSKILEKGNIFSNEEMTSNKI